MLRALHIRDFVIVTETDISFDSGFTVFSGETGAGKSILIDALALTLGARADSSVLRQGATRAEISAVFDTPDTLTKWLSEHDLHAEDELVLRRIVDAQGRSRAYINGSAVTITQLREIGEHLVDIHGQHAHQSLLRPESQRDLLDTHGSLQAQRLSVTQAWKAWRSVQRKLALSEQDASTLAAAREKIEWQLGLLDQLALTPGEWDTISNEHTRLANAQSLLDGAAQILNWLDEDEDSVHQKLSASLHRASQLLKHDSALKTVHDALDSATIAVGEAVSDLNAYLSRVELDPERLAQTEERMRMIFDTARQFKVEPEQLTALVRPKLGRMIMQSLIDEQSNLSVMTLEPGLEQLLHNVLQQSQPGQPVVLEPNLSESLFASLRAGCRFLEEEGHPAVLVVSPLIRGWLSKAAKQRVNDLTVLSYSEIPDDQAVKVIHTVDVKSRKADDELN